MLTKPADLDDEALSDALRRGWGFTPASLVYQAVGFGSHHWLATDALGERRFVTVDDLAANVRTAGETADAVFGRLHRAFATALSLRELSGLEFVLAPLRGNDGRLVRRVDDRYSVVLHPYLIGHNAGDDGVYRSGSDRRAVLEMIIRIHRAQAAAAGADDFVVPHLDGLGDVIGQTSRTWDSGPYGEIARRLLVAHAADLEKLVAAYAVLAARVAARPERMVITHGEPRAGNVIVTQAGLVLADWDTALLAPPERDLWDLAQQDRSLLGRYRRATGLEVDRDALTLYSLWFDLTEISSFLGLFVAPHDQSAQTATSLQKLRDYLRPAQRWPALMRQDSGGHGQR